ncbi:FecR family protein [Olivibacter sp. XZL3]|uniref:FecR family protein n=1 Tax=Olivibacter sp. XZL3 TaxID=1735116 RepID=UPI0010652A56|nr:FecR domain-containing protein [Olivibacter sp. XZL3]
MNETLLQELFRKYRNQSLNSQEEALFFSLLQDPEYKDHVEALLRELWAETECFEYAPLTPAGKRRIASVMGKVVIPERPTKRRVAPFWAAAASIVVLIGLALFYRSSQQVKFAPAEASHIAEIKTNYGEKKKATLPDGTQIHLNAGSVLRYDNTYNKDKREIELIGEAFFEVAPDELRPFIVRSQQLKTYVLGTSFNVRAFEEDENLFVALITGSVRIDDGSSSSLLKPGEKINYNKRTATSEVSAIQEKDYWGLWRKEVLAFNEQRFEEVAALLEKWYGVHIHIHNKALLKRRFTGEFKGLAINKVLDMLSKSSPFTYNIENDQVYIK